MACGGSYTVGGSSSSTSFNAFSKNKGKTVKDKYGPIILPGGFIPEFAHADELASLWCEWIELELVYGNNEYALWLSTYLLKFQTPRNLMRSALFECRN